MQFLGRSTRAVVQLLLITAGSILIITGLLGLAYMLVISDLGTFVGGLAILYFSPYVFAGFVLLSLGLILPQKAEEGIHVNRFQRKLLIWGIIAPVIGFLSIPVGSIVLPPLPPVVLAVLIGGIFGILVSGPLATLTVVGMLLKSTSRDNSGTQKMTNEMAHHE